MEQLVRREKLKRWKEEKLLKAQQEKENKKPPFKCGFIAHKLPPFLINSNKLSKPSELRPVQKVNKKESYGLQIKGAQTKSKATRTKNKANEVKMSLPVQVQQTRTVVKHDHLIGKQKLHKRPLKILTENNPVLRSTNVIFDCQISAIEPTKRKAPSVVRQIPDGPHGSCFVNSPSTVLSKLQSDEQSKRTSTPKQSHLREKANHDHKNRNLDKTCILSDTKKNNIAPVHGSDTFQKCLSNPEHDEMTSDEIVVIAPDLSNTLLIEFHQRKMNQTKTIASVDAISSIAGASPKSTRGTVNTEIASQENKQEENEHTTENISSKKISEILQMKTSTGSPRESTPYCIDKRVTINDLDSVESPIYDEYTSCSSAVKDQKVLASLSSGLTYDFKRLCLDSLSNTFN